MGLLDKVKGILFDEEEIELPEIKKETKKEIKREKIEEDSIKEIKMPKEDFSDREYKSESTFTFPIDFEDEEPVIIEEKQKPKVEEYRPIHKPEKRDYSDFLNKRDTKKQFKPTPIISPVYGVLDQNYKKEDVIVKKDVLRRPNELSLEEVRKRAFGSLEDELEQNLTSDTKEIKIKEELKIKKEKIIETKKVEEPVDKLKTIGELIEEDNNRIDIPDIECINEEEIEYTNDSVTEIEEPTKRIEDLLDEEENIIEEKEEIKEFEEDDEIDEDEADLFSLIDSMYEEKGE